RSSAALPGSYAAQVEHHRHVLGAARLRHLHRLPRRCGQGLDVLALAGGTGAVQPRRHARLPPALVDGGLVPVPVTAVADLQLLGPGVRAVQTLERPGFATPPRVQHDGYPLGLPPPFHPGSLHSPDGRVPPPGSRSVTFSPVRPRRRRPAWGRRSPWRRPRWPACGTFPPPPGRRRRRPGPPAPTAPASRAPRRPPP